MTALMKYLAVLGFTGELSLAATSSFAPKKSRPLEPDLGCALVGAHLTSPSEQLFTSGHRATARSNARDQFTG